MIAYPYHVGGGTELDIEEARDILYGEEFRDPSPEGYLDLNYASSSPRP